MTNMISSELVLKSDKAGKVRTPIERQEQVLAEFDRSGMSGMAFARHYGINYQTFIAWLRKRRSRSDADRPERVNLVEAVIEMDQGRCFASGSAVRVQLPGGASVEIKDKAQVELIACLIRTLGAVQC